MVIARGPRKARISLITASRPKRPSDLRMAAVPKRPRLGKPASAASKIVPAKRVFVPREKEKGPRTSLFTIGGRKFVPSSVPRGLDRWQAGRLMAHKETVSNVGSSFEAMIRAASRPPLRRAA
jgi:hypothetical protein